MNNSANLELGDYEFLVVNDEQFICNLIIRILGTMGVDAERTSSCSSGEEAVNYLNALAGEPPDFVLCDLNMPDMDGVEFLRHLAARSYDGGIILISGEDKRILKAAEDLARAHDLHFLGALSKPVTPADLGALLSTFTPERARRGARRHVEVGADDLREAIANRDITVVFQPKVSVKTGELIGVETLARWTHSDKGFVPPDVFVHVAEENGMIDDLTNLIVELAISQAGEWLADGLDLKVAVNLSVDNLNNLELPEFLIGLAETAGMNPHRLVLEVTESRLMEDILKPLEILTRLRIKGLELSIDDFGTGHSSLEQLKRIPFTELKIDRAFVNGAAGEPATRAILETAVDLAKRLEMSIVAEGVEDQEDWDLVASLGCDLVQGYFVSKPMEGAEIAAWRESRAGTALGGG